MQTFEQEKNKTKAKLVKAMTIILMIIKTMLMMMMRGAFHRLLATLVPDTHISSGTKSKL